MGSFSGYRRIIGSIGWPANSRPGVAIIVGEDHIEDKELGRRPLWVLDEAETEDVVELHNQCLIFQMEHGLGEWIGDCTNQVMAVFEDRNRKNQMKNRPGIRVVGAQVLNASNPFKVATELITQRVRKDKKSLHFGNSSFLPARLTEIEKEDAHTRQLDNYPAIAALGYAVCHLDLNQPTPARRVKNVSARGWT